MRLIAAGSAILVTLLLSGKADAGLITEYALAGAPGNQAFQTPNASAVGVTGLNLTRGSGIVASSASNSFSSSGWASLGADDYFSFGFTVDSGYSVDLNDLKIGTRSSNTGPGSLGLFYSGDGFASSLATFTQSGTAFLNSTIDLTSLTGLTGNVEFRIFTLNSTSANGGTLSDSGTFRLANFFDTVDSGAFGFDGTVSTISSVPEPSTIAFLAIAGTAGFASRLRKQKKSSSRF